MEIASLDFTLRSDFGELGTWNGGQPAESDLILLRDC